MWKILFIGALISASAHADQYNPATNRLTIPSITVDGITYTDVVVTVGSIVSIGSSTAVTDDGSKNWSCSWSSAAESDYKKFKYDLTLKPLSGTIDLSMTGLTNKSEFFYSSITLVQNGKSTGFTPFPSLPGVVWTGEDGFISGFVPTGVTKSASLSRFPSWFDLSKPFSWIESSGDAHTCE